MQVEYSFVLSHIIQHLLFKRLRPLFESYDYVLRTQVEHNFVDSFELVLNHATFYLHKTSFHGSSKQVCSRLEGCCWKVQVLDQ